MRKTTKFIIAIPVIFDNHTGVAVPGPIECSVLSNSDRCRLAESVSAVRTKNIKAACRYSIISKC